MLWLLPVLQTYAQTSTTASIVLTENESEFGAEFLEALRFSYDNGLTRYKDVQNFRPYATLTREQASKIIWVFAADVLGMENIDNKSCSFPDIDDADLTLADYILSACKLGIFNGSGDGKFYPTKSISKAEWLTVVIRMLKWWSLDETTEPRYLNYYLEAKELELTREKNLFALDRWLTRYEMILLLYRFYVKLNIIDLVKNNKNIINSNAYGISTVGNGVVVFDHNKFVNSESESFPVMVGDNMRRLQKTNVVQHFDNASTRYGDLYLLNENIDEEWTYAWVATFNIVDGQVTNGNIRPIEFTDSRYEFSLTDVVPFFQSELIGDDIVISSTTIVPTDTAVVETEITSWSLDTDDTPEVVTIVEVEVELECDMATSLGSCNELDSCDRVTATCNGRIPVLWCVEIGDDYVPMTCR